MSCPSDLHESLRADLATVAILGGYPLEFPIEGELIPDVIRADRLGSSVFVGDAKATETPGNTATRSRLGAYARMVADWCHLGLSLRFAIAHPRASADWVGLLESLCREAGVPPLVARCDVLSECSTISWVRPWTRPKAPQESVRIER